MSLLTNWYFTACLNLRAKEASDLIAIFEELDMKRGGPRLASAAIAELRRCDIWAKVFAVPKLVELARTDRRGNLREQAELLLDEIIGLCEDETFKTGLRDALIVRLGGVRNGVRNEDRLTVALDRLAVCIASDDKSVEDVPYLGLPTTIAETLFLAVLELATSDAGMRASLAQSLKERSVPIIQLVLDKAQQGMWGRLAVLQAARIVRNLEGETAGSRISLQLMRLSGVAGLLEPDIAELCADFEMRRSGEPVGDALAACHEFEARANPEVRSQFHELRDACGASSRVNRQVTSRLGIAMADRARMEELNWEAGIAAAVAGSGSELFARAFAQRWSRLLNFRRAEEQRTEGLPLKLQLAAAAVLCPRLAAKLERDSIARVSLLQITTHAERSFSDHHNKWLRAAGRPHWRAPEFQPKERPQILPNVITAVVIYARVTLADVAVRDESLPPEAWLEAANSAPWMVPPLIRWTESLFMGSPEEPAIVRWQAALPRLLEAAGTMKREDGWDTSERLRKALLERFCLQPARTPQAPHRWWEELTSAEKFSQPHLLHLRLQLARWIVAHPPPDSRDWEQLGWLFSEENREVTAQIRLAATIERFLAPEGPGLVSRAERVRSLAEVQAGVFVATDLDRWARHRLLDVVRHPEGGDAGRLATQLIVQLGRPVDAERLVSALLSDAGASTPDLEWKLQMVAEGFAARAHIERRADAGRSQPMSPRIALRNAEESDYWLVQSATVLAFCPVGVAEALRRRFADARAAQEGLHRAGVLSINAVEEFHGRTVLATRNFIVPVFPWMTEQVIADAEHGRFTILHSRFWLQREGRKGRAAVALGGASGVLDAQAADWLPLHTRYPGTGDRTAGRIGLHTGQGRFDEIKRMPVDGGKYPGKGRRRRDGMCEFEILGDVFCGIERRPALEVWDADESLRFSKVERGREWKDLVVVYQQRAWKPARQQIHDLVAQGGGSTAPFSAVLTFMAVERGKYQDQSWLFSTIPGTCFELRPELFTTAASSRLRRLIEDRRGDVGGLRVRVTATRDAANGRLLLTTSAEDIDDTNLRWREMFRVGDVVTAVRREGDGRFVVRSGVDLPPFPDEIEVAEPWEGDRWPRPHEQEVTAIVTSWTMDDRLNNRVRLQCADARSLRAVGGSSNTALREYVLSLSVREPIQLKRVYGRAGEQGSVLAVTPEELGVQVSAESLNLLEDDGRPPRDMPREAVITRVRWQPRSDISIEFPAQNFGALARGEHIGVVFEVPNRSANHDVCRVIFAGAEAPIFGRLRSDRTPHLGSKVVVNVNDGATFRGRVEELTIYAEALFRISRIEQPPAGSQFVGFCRENRQQIPCWVHPKHGGELLIGRFSNLRWRLFETWRATTTPSPEPTWPTKQAAINVSISPFWDPVLRARDVNLSIERLEDENDGTGPLLLAGLCPGIEPVGRYEIHGIELNISACRDGLYRVRRLFLGRRTEEIEEEPATAERPDRAAELANLEADGRAQHAVLRGSDDSSWKVLLPALKESRLSNAESTLEVPLEELHHFYYARDISYDREEARVMVMRNSGRWIASFRRVPAESMEGYHETTGAPVGEPFAPPSSFVFIGRGEGDRSHLLRFEFGFGWVMETDEKRVRIDPQAKASVRTLLFHGDRLKTLRFVEDSNLGLCLEVLGVEIALGDAHHVYLQASRHRFVHTLVLERRCDEPRVIAIKGFSEAGERHQQEFSVPYASLPAAERAAWLARLAATDSGQLSTYARLDAGLFERTEGQVCEFRPVPFAFGSGALRVGDRLLVEAGELLRTKSGNDVRLVMNPLSGIESSAHGKTSSPLSVRRREFSVRESLLARFISPEEETSAALRGLVFALTIVAIHDGRPRATMLTMPPRRLEALLGVLRSAPGAIFATAADPGRQTSENNILARLEVRPGVFFNLARQHVEAEMPVTLGEGTLVRLELGAASSESSPRVRVTVCQFSDLRYLSKELERPGVILPTDLLTKPDAKFGAYDWTRGQLFTAADFAGKFDVAYAAENARAAMGKFMSQVHPKFGWLGRRLSREGPDDAVFIPAEGFDGAGFLCCGEGSDVRVARPKGGDLRAAWHLLSYADVPIAELRKRCEERRWFVHDRMTGNWARGDTETYPIGELSVRTGPLFFDFDARHNEVRLRYAKTSDLRRFGVPLISIADAFGVRLHEQGHQETVTIAAIEQFDDQVDALWIEWLPGRVMEIPVAMLSWRSGSDVLSLLDFDWTAVACGDELDLRLVAGEALSPDRIEVIAWRRGARGACVSREGRALLPNCGPVDGGGVALGAGQFQFTMPLAPEAHREPAYLLGAANRPEPIRNQRVHPGDTVFIEVRSVDEAILGIAGAPQWEARPDRERSSVDFEAHPLTAEMFQGKPTPFIVRRHFVEWIQAAGGALPATFEALDTEHGIVYFSLRRKSPQIPVGRFSQSAILGLTSDLRFAAVSIAGGTRMLPLYEMVDCVPSAMWETVCREMVAQRVPVWWKQTAATAGRLTAGLTDDIDGDLWVRPVFAVGIDKNAGLLVRACRSQRLYWIPRSFLAWIDLQVEDIHSLFVVPARDPMMALRANLKLGGDGVPYRLSLVHTAEAVREERALYPGYQLMADVVKGCAAPTTTGGRSWLVRSRDTRLLMRCDVPKEPWLKEREPQLVEVESRRFEQVRRVSCAPYGRRIILVDLPEAAIRQIENATSAKRAVSRWREALLHYERLDLEQLRMGPPDPALDVRLSWAWELCGRRNVLEPVACEIAFSWLSALNKAEPCALPAALMATATLSAALAGAATTTTNVDAMSFDRGWTILTSFFGDLHRRLSRSRHVAILLSRLSRNQLRSDPRFAALHRRLVRLLSEPLEQPGRAEIMRLAEQLLMDPGADRHQLAGALMSCLGHEPPPQAMPALIDVESAPKDGRTIDEVRLVDDLTVLCAPFADTPRRSGRDTGAALIAASLTPVLNTALQRWRQFEWDVILLGEIPPVFNIGSGIRPELSSAQPTREAIAP